MRVTSKVNYGNLKKLDYLMKNTLVKAVDDMRSNVIESRIMPFDTGEMQNRSTYIDDKDLKKGVVYLRTDGSKVRRLYFHPEFKFKKDKNPNAQGLWFEAYISGTKKLYLRNAFAKLLRKELSKYDSK